MRWIFGLAAIVVVAFAVIAPAQEGVIFRGNTGVTGPGTSADNAAARFDGTGGQTLQNSALLIADTTAALTRTGAGGISVQGTNTNDNAAAGSIGEVISATVLVGSAVSLTTATAADITSISLTAGDWEVTGAMSSTLNAGTTASIYRCWYSITSATLPTIPNSGGYADLRLTFATGAPQSIPCGTMRFSLAGTTTVFLSTQMNFAVSTAAAYGYIQGRRTR